MNLFEPLVQAIVKRFPELKADDLQFAPPPNLDAGDVALRTFVAAKKTGSTPPALAKRIADEVPFGPEVSAVEIAGPYVNFRLDRGRFARIVVSSVLAQRELYGSAGFGTGQKLLIEHTSINPNASPHVGRARNAIYGDTLARLFRFEGYDVDVHYYVNDIGRQIGLLVLHCGDLAGMTFDDVLDAYVAANEKAEADEEFAGGGKEKLVTMEGGEHGNAREYCKCMDICE